MTIASSKDDSLGVQPIVWQQSQLLLLDQRVLPQETRYLTCTSADDVADAIEQMAVRGAPAIGIAAAYGLVLDAITGGNFLRAKAVLAASRPTAVNLMWALDRMEKVFAGSGGSNAELEREAIAIHQEDLKQNLTMGKYGAELLGSGVRVLTHCNTGALATGGHGTALGIIRSAWRKKQLVMAYCTETRPWLQGARLTAWELSQENIPATLIVDSAAAGLMQAGKIDCVIVGADRIAANGDTANKVGTLSLACAAAQFGIPFYVAAPTGTFDLGTATGADIPVESRDSSEITSFRGVPIAPKAMRAENPVFDITPAKLITAIVCERGVIDPVTVKNIKKVVG